jgi:hypothetical protein
MSHERPAGITAIVWLCVVLALTSLVFAVLIFAGQLPLSSGAFLLGNGLEQSGPLAFVIYAALLLVVALGLLRRRNLARRAAILLAVAGIALAVPAISSAVVDSRLFAIAREGAQIILRVLIVFYLTQEPVRSWFESAE